MICKQSPVPEYPQPEDVYALASLAGQQDILSPLFFDIETTGLSSEKSRIYLIGCVHFDQSFKQWELTQWMAEDAEQETLLLQTFLDFLDGYDCLIQYNGNRFDLPFLETRCKVHGLGPSRKQMAALDLFDALRPCRSLFQLKHMTQKDLEKFLDLPTRKYPDGKKCIQLYLTWQQGHSPALEEAVLGHNQEDLCRLGRILEMTGYLALWNGSYQPDLAMLLPEDRVQLSFYLSRRLPKSVTVETEEFSLQMRENKGTLRVKMKDHRLRQYYSNYRDYVYLPAEDTAIPKTLGRFLDPDLKESASPGTCYTRFPVTEEFLLNPRKQMQYLQHFLPFYLTYGLSMRK